MSVNIRIPSLGESVSEAEITRWLVKEGDFVEVDQDLCEIDSDKASASLPSPARGILSKILKSAGSVVAIGEPIGEISPSDAATAPAGALPPPPPAPGTASLAPEAAPAESAPTVLSAPLSPAVRRLVAESKIDPADVAPSGKGGRLTKGDVLEHLETRGASGRIVPQEAPAAPPPLARPSDRSAPSGLGNPVAPRPDEDRLERVRMSRLRKTVATRLVEVQQNAAILTTFNEIDMSAVMNLRRDFQPRFQEKYGIKLGFMSFFVKACIDALKAWPGVNAEIEGDDILYKKYYDIGVAVGGGKGLVVPVVRDADRLSFAELELKIAELGKKARDNKLSLEDLSGGTFTLSNGGVYGSMMSTPILNAPQTGILGMHNIVDRPVAVLGQIEIRPMMYVALSYDHRVIDGREAVSFLVRVKECVERPERMLLEV